MILGQLKIGEHQAKWSALVGLSKYSNVVQWSPNANAESCWWSLISLIYRKLTFPHGQRPSSAHHPLEADSASELQRYFASGANHSLRTPGNHENCQISKLGNSSENSTWVFLLSPFWLFLASGWWVDDRQVEANCGYSRAVHCRWKPRLRESPPLLRSPVLSCLSSLWVLARDNRQTTEFNGRSSYQKIPSEMEVAPRYNCWHCWHCWHSSTLFDTVDMTYNE